MWGALRFYQRDGKQARKRNSYSGVLVTTKELSPSHYPGRTTLRELLTQTSPSSFIPSTFHTSFTFLFRLRACWSLGHLLLWLLWLYLHCKNCYLFIFHQDSYWINKLLGLLPWCSCWRYLPGRCIVLTKATHPATKSPVLSVPWYSTLRNRLWVNHLNIKELPVFHNGEITSVSTKDMVSTVSESQLKPSCEGTN